jgi:hypothetical protein
MKKFKLLFFLFSLLVFSGISTGYGSAVIRPVENEVPASMAALKYLQASEFVKLSVSEYTKLTGKKLNFLQKLSFKVTKMKMKHDLKKNSSLKITDYIDGDGTTFQIDILWLLLGLLLPVIGVLIAYLTKQESYKITSAWIGFGAFILVAVIFGGSIF